MCVNVKQSLLYRGEEEEILGFTLPPFSISLYQELFDELEMND